MQLILYNNSVHTIEHKLISLVQSCNTFKQLRQIQSQIIVNATHYHNRLLSSLFLSKCSEFKKINHAREVFDQLPDRRYTSLWNVISKGYLQNNHYDEVMVLFRDMLRENVKLNCYTLPVVLKSCCKSLAFTEGEQVHCAAIKVGFKSNTYVGTNLIDLYSCVGYVGLARKVFAETTLKNVVSWTAMINGYVANGDLVTAMKLFHSTPNRDVVLWNRMVTAHIESGDMVEARNLFNEMPSKDLISYNTLLNGYANNGDVESCERLFESMQERNVFSWNGLIGGYAHNGRFNEVLDVFQRMLKDPNVQPNDATLVNVASACARLGALDYGKWVHKYTVDNGYKGNISVCNALIDMYAKCGLVECAMDVFRRMDEKDLISWNTVINALAVHDNGADALEIFQEMKSWGEKPDGVTFIGILCACSHMGLIEEGLAHFRSMSNEYGIEPQMKHYGCVVDLLGRGGFLEEAMEFVHNMPIQADSVIWTSLLAASRVQKKTEFVELSLQKLIKLDPKNPAIYVMVSNIYGEDRNWEEQARLKVAMRNTGSKKVPGYSAVETDNGIVEFYAFDESHAKTQDIYDALRGLTMVIRLFADESELILE